MKKIRIDFSKMRHPRLSDFKTLGEYFRAFGESVHFEQIYRKTVAKRHGKKGGQSVSQHKLDRDFEICNDYEELKAARSRWSDAQIAETLAEKHGLSKRTIQRIIKSCQ